MTVVKYCVSSLGLKFRETTVLLPRGVGEPDALLTLRPNVALFHTASTRSRSETIR